MSLDAPPPSLILTCLVSSLSWAVFSAWSRWIFTLLALRWFLVEALVLLKMTSLCGDDSTDSSSSPYSYSVSRSGSVPSSLSGSLSILVSESWGS